MFRWLRRHLPFGLGIVDGDSMLPTLCDGDWLFFLRRSFKTGDVVLADLGPDDYVVKRVILIKRVPNRTAVVLTGDNTEVTGTYLAYAEDILGVALCRIWRGRD